MGQKTNPIGFRLGIIKTWDSKWFASKNYAMFLHEDLAIKKRPASEIAAQAITEGMITLEEDGLIKAAKGITTISEVLRVTTSG